MEIREILVPKHETRAGETVDLVVIHYTAGGPSAEATAREFARPGRSASAHYIIGRAGEIVQCVERHRGAWHAGDRGKSRFPSGVQIEGSVKDASGRTFVSLRNVPPKPHNTTRRSIGIELCNRGWAPHTGPSFEGRHRNPGVRSTLWQPFPPEQLASLAWLLQKQVADIPSLRYITGHEDVTNQWTIGDNPKTPEFEKVAGAKTDPGPAFPWPEYPGLTRVWFDFTRKGWVS